MYDSLYQLTRENNQKAGKSWTYTYDSAGNILSKKEYAYSTGSLGSVVDTITYTYGNSNWGDQLTSYDGTAITYDAIGNPLNWTDGRTFTWNGRQLSSITDSDGTIAYTYNADGIRTKKQWVLDDEATETIEYILDDNNTLLGEIYTYTEADGYIETESIYYFYDESGSPVYCKYNGATYYYVKNQQGDITGLMKSDGTMSVTYEYDAWGNLISSSRNGSDAYGLYTLNVYTYRGYIYDKDTGFYYLQSRYYDPEVGRFLNADDTNYLGASGTTLGYNLYSYCENNWVIYSDNQGTYIQYAAGAIVGGLLNAVLYIVDCSLAKTNISNWKLLWNFLNGAINGFVAALGGSLLRQIFASVGSSIVSLFIGTSSPSVQDFVIAIISGVLSGVFAGTMGNGNNKHINRLMDKFGKKISKSIFKSSFGKTVVNGFVYVINNSKTIIKNFLSSYVIPNIKIAIGSRAVSTIWKILS